MEMTHASSLPRLAYKGIPVVTTETLAQAYEVDATSLRKNFSCNKERFTEGKHFFSITGQELNDFRLSITESNSQISSKVRALTLWTERGAARHAKMLNSDRAWDVFEMLEETFFRVARVVEQPQPAATLTPADRAELKALVDAKLSTADAAVQGRARAEIWTRFNRHFKIAEYAQLPTVKMPEARDYIIAMRVKALRPLPSPASSSLADDMVLPPAAQKAADSLHENMEAIRLLIRRIRDHEDALFGAARSFVLPRNAGFAATGGLCAAAIWTLDTMQANLGAIDRSLETLEASARVLLALRAA